MKKPPANTRARAPDASALQGQAEQLRQRLAATPDNAGVRQQLAFVLHELGQHAEAVQAFAAARAGGASARVQAAAEAISLSALGRHAEGIDLLAPIQARNPREFMLANTLGVICKRAGRFDEAIRALTQASQLAPRSASPLQNLGNVHDVARNYPAALKAYAAALRLDPGNAELLRLHGYTLYQLRRQADALPSLRKALVLAPRDTRVADLLVRCLLETGALGEAVEAATAFNDTCQGDPESRVILARALNRSGRYPDARKLLEETLAQQPNHFSTLMLLGSICGDGDRRTATEAYRAAAAARPDAWAAADNLIFSLSRARYDSETQHLEDAYRLALEFLARFPEQVLPAARNLRTTFGRMLDLENFERSGTLRELLPRWQDAGEHSAVHYELGQVHTLEDRLALVEWHREWGRRKAERVTPVVRRDPPAVHAGRKIRVGFMSSDLRNHPVGYFAQPLLLDYDRDRFEVFCYSFYEGARDAVQAELEQRVTGFRWWPKTPDQKIAEGIAADGLDLLFELGGSSAMNRLEVMAYRPARLQASWLGYPHSAGLAAIDYILVDPWLRPPNPALLIEQPFELPESWVTVSEGIFRPVPVAPDPPCTRKGWVTFGTANNPYKFTTACVDAWAAVLRAVPGSRFLFLRPEAGAPGFIENARRVFEQRDVDPGRVEFIGVRGAHLPHYNEMDIALDSLPHVGGTTTCEALWMGVPTVSLVGPGFPERLSYSNLTNAGLGDLAVDSVEAYVATAAALAADPARLRHLRRELRAMIRSNPLGQVERFVRHFYAKAAEVAGA